MKSYHCIFFSVFLVSFLWSCEQKKTISINTALSQQMHNQNEQMQIDVPQPVEAQKATEAEVNTRFLNTTDFQSFMTNFFFKNSKNRDIEALNALIHEDLGIFVVHKTTSYATITNVNSMEDVTFIIPQIADILQKGFCDTILDTKEPSYNCDDFARNGCYYLANIPQKITERIENIEGIIGNVIEENIKNKATESQKYITKVVLITDSFVECSFALIDGKWYLVMIDSAKYDCNA